MPVPRESDARAFLQHMVWRPGDQAEPIVALLGPRASGKTSALEALNTACGGTIVHAKRDFSVRDLDPVQAIGATVFDLQRSWVNVRHKPTFHRFGLTALALNEKLDNDRARAREQISRLIRQYVRNTPKGRAAVRVQRGVDEWAAPRFSDRELVANSCCRLHNQMLVQDFLRGPIAEP